MNRRLKYFLITVNTLLSLCLLVILVACVTSWPLYGYINPKGQFVIPPQYQYAAEFKNKAAQVGRERASGILYGCIDTQGHVIYPLQKLDSGVLDSQGHVLFQDFGSGDNAFCYERVEPVKVRQLSLDLMNGQDRKKYYPKHDDKSAQPVKIRKPMNSSPTGFLIGLADHAGHVILKPDYDEITEFKNGFARIKKGNQWHFIDANGTITQTSCQELSDFSDGLAKCQVRIPFSFFRVLLQYLEL